VNSKHMVENEVYVPHRRQRRGRRTCSLLCLAEESSTPIDRDRRSTQMNGVARAQRSIMRQFRTFWFSRTAENRRKKFDVHTHRCAAGRRVEIIVLPTSRSQNHPQPLKNQIERPLSSVVNAWKKHEQNFGDNADQATRQIGRLPGGDFGLTVRFCIATSTRSNASRSCADYEQQILRHLVASICSREGLDLPRGFRWCAFSDRTRKVFAEQTSLISQTRRRRKRAALR